MKYPKYLSVGNWLFKHIEPDWFYQNDKPVGGPIPDNLYYDCDMLLNLSRDLRTYEGLIEYGCTEPDEKELLRLLHI
jgi:hypothetical protein